MEETKKIIIDEEKLFLSLEYYRLKKDLELIESKIKDNAPIDSSQERNKINKVWQDRVLNNIRKNKVDSLAEERNKYLNQIDSFDEKHGSAIIKNVQELKDMIEEFFKKDLNNEARILLGIKLSLNSEYSYYNEKESLEKVSNLLFGNNDKLQELKEELKKNYYSINKKNLKELDKNVWKGLGIVLAASFVAGPIGTLAATANKDVKESLNDICNASNQAGIAALTLSAVTLNVFLVGATASVIGLKELNKDSMLKKEFRAITPDSLAMRFAIKATILEEIQKKGEKEIFNLCLDDALQVLDNYRSDAEYMMIIEHEDLENASRKVNICNHLFERLVEISKK